MTHDFGLSGIQELHHDCGSISSPLPVFVPQAPRNATFTSLLFFSRLAGCSLTHVHNALVWDRYPLSLLSLHLRHPNSIPFLQRRYRIFHGWHSRRRRNRRELREFKCTTDCGDSEGKSLGNYEGYGGYEVEVEAL